MKILFAIHQLDYADHIAISYLSAIAKELKHSTYFCVFEHQDFLEEIEKIRPEVIAYSANLMGFGEMVEKNRAAKAEYEFGSILGGPQATF